MSLKYNIRKQLIETKENKGRLLQESKIIQTRFLMIAESSKIKTKKQLDDAFVNLLSEMIYLHKQGFDSTLIKESAESVFEVLGKLFGGSTNAVVELFKEKGVRWILEKLGIEDNNFLKNFLITALGNTDLKDVPKLFSDCDFLTEKISESIPEAYLRQLEYEKGMGGDFMDFVRNSLYDVIKSSDFGDKVKEKISGIVCPLVDNMSEKFGNQLDSMKSSLIPADSDTQS
jgi:hypothetical protein